MCKLRVISQERLNIEVKLLLSVITSSDSYHATVANLLREIIMVRDHFLTLPQWFTRDDIDEPSPAHPEFSCSCCC